MDINQLLQGYSCSCGKRHDCAIKYVYIEKDAHLHLKELCAAYENILLVADENTYAADGEKVFCVLSDMDKNVKKIIFPGDRILVPDEAAVEAVNHCLNGIQLILGVGSGVIQDLCKYTAHVNGLPYMVVATAPSMDGYASSGAAMIMGGMKVTYPAGVPEAILADPEVLAEAPIDMIKAGYGDIIGKYSALNDWKLGRVMYGEYFCQENYDLTMQMVQNTLKLADGLLKREPESLKALMEALVVVGIAMSFVGNSRPASGSEHHFSHFFEITGIANGEDYFPHGIDVVYSAVLTTKIREEILNLPDFDREQFQLSREAYEKTMQEIYGDAAAGCMALQDKLGRYTEDRVSRYREHESEIRSILQEAPSSEEMLRLLQKAELDMKDFYEMYSPKKLADAVSWAKDLKDRYTVLWMYYDLCGI